jgi:hypothetical protein
VVEGPIRAIEQPINPARHDEVVLMQSFDLAGERDSSITPAEADVRMIAFCLGKLTNFLGEQQAAEKLVEAGRLLAREPQAMQLRYFAALHDIASERSSTIVFPLPTDLLTHLVPRPDGAK